ncbi:hypothetical protein BGX28_010311, partial [Mortierella sp. GBA30]
MTPMERLLQQQQHSRHHSQTQSQSQSPHSHSHNPLQRPPQQPDYLDHNAAPSSYHSPAVLHTEQQTQNQSRANSPLQPYSYVAHQDHRLLDSIQDRDHQYGYHFDGDQSHDPSLHGHSGRRPVVHPSEQGDRIADVHQYQQSNSHAYPDISSVDRLLHAAFIRHTPGPGDPGQTHEPTTRRQPTRQSEETGQSYQPYTSQPYEPSDLDLDRHQSRNQNQNQNQNQHQNQSQHHRLGRVAPLLYPSQSMAPGQRDMDYSLQRPDFQPASSPPSPPTTTATTVTIKASAPGDEMYTHPRTAPLSDRHYVLTSIASTPFAHHRLDVSRRSPAHPVIEATEAMPLRSSTAPSSHIAPRSAPAHPAVPQQPPTHQSSTAQSPSSYGNGSGNGSIVDLAQGRDPQKAAQKIPPRIRTQWSHDQRRHDCPPLSFQSSSSQSLSSNSADSKMSPFTPRSGMIPRVMSRSTLDSSHTELDFVKANHPSQLSHVALLPNQSSILSDSPIDGQLFIRDRDDHDMEHCSEQDDVREREHEEEDEDDDEEEYRTLTAQQVCGLPFATTSHKELTPREAMSTSKKASFGRDNATGAIDDGVEDDEDIGEEGNSFASSSSSRKPSMARSPSGGDEPKAGKKAARAKAVPRKRGPRPPSVQAAFDEAIGELEDESHAHDSTGSQSLHGKGLGYYAPLVCNHVEAKIVTNYNDLVNELAGSQPGTQPGERTDGSASQESSGQG